MEDYTDRLNEARMRFFNLGEPDELSDGVVLAEIAKIESLLKGISREEHKDLQTIDFALIVIKEAVKQPIKTKPEENRDKILEACDRMSEVMDVVPVDYKEAKKILTHIENLISMEDPRDPLNRSIMEGLKEFRQRLDEDEKNSLN